MTLSLLCICLNLYQHLSTLYKCLPPISEGFWGHLVHRSLTLCAIVQVEASVLGACCMIAGSKCLSIISRFHMRSPKYCISLRPRPKLYQESSSFSQAYQNGLWPSMTLQYGMQPGLGNLAESSQTVHELLPPLLATLPFDALHKQPAHS